MRTGIELLFAIALVVCPLTVMAQFQAPTDEELKMTAEPKAPGASAIYLYREETTDDNIHIHTSYERVKVLTEKGKELATVGVPYSREGYRVTDIKARTIHADGTVIPLNVQPTDLVESKGAGFQINRMVFTLPSVEVGSILEYRWELRYDDNWLSSPEWDVQQKLFVRKAHYVFSPFNRINEIENGRGESASKLLDTYILPPNTKPVRDINGKYTLDITDVPPVPEEEFMPPVASVALQLEFYYSPYNSKDEFWKNEGNRWSKEMNRFAGETKTLKEAVSGIVTSTDSEDAKASKIYKAVMALENTDYTRRKSAAELKQLGQKAVKTAEDVWKAKSGTSDEIALLYLAMARIAGLKSYAAYVTNRNRRIFNAYYLSMSQFDDVLVYVSIDGKEKLLDPGEKFASYGQLHWKHYLAGCIRQTEGGPVLSITPGNSYKEASTTRVAAIDISADGSVTGTLRIAMSGPEALRWRQEAIDNDPVELKKLYEESIGEVVPDGVHVEFDHFLGLEDYDSLLMGIVKVSGNMGTATGKRVFLPGSFFEAHARHPFVSEATRQTSVDMHFAQVIRDEVTYTLPASFSVESLPPDAVIPWASHAAFATKSKADKQTVQMTRSLAEAFTFLDPKDYPELRSFYQKAATTDQQPLVLVRSAVAATN